MPDRDHAILEVACFTAESVIVAAKHGVKRVELCRDQQAGGLTPPIEWLRLIKERGQVDGMSIIVMIRPRGGDFCYTEEEFEVMKMEIRTFKDLPAPPDGYVFGILHRDRTIDAERTAELVHIASPLPCTFHRAFDDVKDASLALEQVIETGCNAILTSGGAADAARGVTQLVHLVELAAGRIHIIPGGEVRASNLADLRETGATIYHTSACLPGSATPDSQELRRMKMILQDSQS